MIFADSRLLQFGTAIRLRADWSDEFPSDCRDDNQHFATVRRIIDVVPDMIGDILDACREVLEINGDPQSVAWLASQMVEMRMWRASEQDVRTALEQDISKLGERSLFLKVADDEYALQAWTESLH